MTARETGAVEPDNRPANCRFRLQDEGKPCPRSGCKACGATVATGLGNKCSRPQPTPSATGEIVERCERAESMVQAVFEGLEAHIRDRMAMGDPASPETYLSILRGDWAGLERTANQICAARWTQQREQNERIEQQAATIAERDARIKALETALRPFADFAEPSAPAEIHITQGSYLAKRQLLMGDCHTARATLERTRGQ